jgi:hypothetical protein
MKKFALLALVALEILVCACGTSTNSTTPVTTTSASGNWQASLVGGRGQSGALDFVTSFSVGQGGGTLSFTALTFLTTNSCFVSGQSVSGNATLTTDSSNNVTGTLNITVNSGTPSGNSLILSGTTVTGTSNKGVLTSGKVTGTWTLTGGNGDSTCSESQPQTFTLTQSTS